jgi:aerobic carbon-monoxide dehydrogenase medium subunit
MIPVPFEYTRPSTVEDAVAALAGAGEDAKVLAGGQSLVPMLRLRLATPTTLVSLTGIGALQGIREDGDELVIGAMTTHDTVLHDELVHRYAPLVAAATATVGDRQVRHLGTFGGSLSHADPAGDLPAVALALDATFTIAGPGGRRAVPAGGFFADYLTTAVAPDEILVEVRLPKMTGWGWHYEKFNRVAQAWAIVGVAAAVRRENGAIAQARVALTNMSNTPVRATAVEQALAGADAAAAPVADAARHAADGTRPTSDVNGSAEYRRHLAGVLTRRAVSRAAGL